MSDGETATSPPWWKTAVLYQIYPRSFADSNSDGFGDLLGIIEHLDHLAWLGVGGIWLSPVTVSPDADWGYDVVDFCAVDPDFGTMEDLDRLIAEAAARGIRVLLDLIPNHTSNQHRWFVDARSSRSARHRDWYVWADQKADGSPPNNWISSFGGPAWTLDESTEQLYLHNHLVEQPDLNWWNEEVRETFDTILSFWLDRGIAGFRIDVCNVIIKDDQLRDNPPATEQDSFDEQLFGQRFVFNANRPEVHGVVRHWRRLTDSYHDSRVLIGETPVRIDDLSRYYGDGTDELHLAFNFPFLTSPLAAQEMRGIVEDVEARFPRDSWPAWTGSNHDMSRFSSRWGEGDPQKARLALVILLTLRGTPVLYQGDEIGLGDVDVAHEDMRDPLGVLYWPAYAGRDAMRTPMQWRGGDGGGFTSPGTRPWLPLGDVDACNVEDQRRDPASFLHLARDLIALRQRIPDLLLGRYKSVPSPSGTWVFARGEQHRVLLNMSDEQATIEGAKGTVLLATDRQLDTTACPESVALGPWQALIVERAAD